MTRYKRVLLKITGELFVKKGEMGIDFDEVKKVASYLAHLRNVHQTELAIVLGGGNLFRGRNVRDDKFDRTQADFIGMLGTIMNGLALQGELNTLGVQSRVMSSLYVNQACEPYIRLRAIHHIEKGNIVILVGGTGKPFFTTDTTAALLAAEMNCEILLKGSSVDGVYSADPRQNKDATKYSSLSFQEALTQGLMVMDDTAFTVCKREKIPIIVFNVEDMENIERILNGETIGTIVS
ncbi:MAG TPA: UMP kinase [Spirochaetia bacterium]|nr:UMP kinase [Spirochaetia bacterium]